jgi:hypothetical protein
VIIGFARIIPGEDFKKRQRLFEYFWQSGTTEEVTVKTGINAYLLDAGEVLIKKRMQPLSKSLNKIFGGSKPTDNGNLVLNEETYSLAVEDPIARKFVHPFRMGEELVKGIERWCLWLEGVSEEEIRNSNFLFQQILKVREFRLGSKKLATRKKAESPHLFDERRQPKTDYLAVPVVVSENRPYFTAALLSSDVIAGNKLFTASDPDGFLFSIISSSMFIAWQRAIGGRLESRLSFSNTIVWNTLPLPPVPEDLRARIIAAGKKILAAREAIEERAGERIGLDKMYASLEDMDPALRKAHEDLDSVVDVAFGASRRCASNEQRIGILIDRYLELTGAAPSMPPVTEPPVSTPPLAA